MRCYLRIPAFERLVRHYRSKTPIPKTLIRPNPNQTLERETRRCDNQATRLSIKTSYLLQHGHLCQALALRLLHRLHRLPPHPLLLVRRIALPPVIRRRGPLLPRRRRLQLFDAGVQLAAPARSGPSVGPGRGPLANLGAQLARDPPEILFEIPAADYARRLGHFLLQPALGR
eukprot:853429-Prorocentrum_minimum.AAC.1